MMIIIYYFTIVYEYNYKIIHTYRKGLFIFDENFISLLDHLGFYVLIY